MKHTNWNRSGDRVANLNLQPRRVKRAEVNEPPVASRTARHSIRRKGTIIRGRPILTTGG